MNAVVFYCAKRVLWREIKRDRKSSSLPCTNDLKIIMIPDHLFIRFCFYTALWAQIFSRYRCIRSFSSNLVYTGALERDVHLASLRVQDSVFVFSKDSLHRLHMSRLEQVCVLRKKMAVRTLFFSLYADYSFFYFVQDKIADDPFHNRYCKRCTKRVILYFASLPFILSMRS